MGLVLCLGSAAVSRKGAGSVLPAVALVYSMLGTLTLSGGVLGNPTPLGGCVTTGRSL